ncbi:hypothetical protein GCM10029963_67100 [Micromonospora andamanensis]
MQWSTDVSGGVLGGRQARTRITELIRAARICTLTTLSLDGRLVARPMTLQRAEFDGQLWFFAYAGSSTVRQVRVNPEIELSLHDPRPRCGHRSPAAPGTTMTRRAPSGCGTRDWPRGSRTVRRRRV